MKLFKKIMDELLHNKINAIGVAANMIWIGIGDTIEVVNRKGDLIKKSSYSIHIQCPWRIVDKSKNKIILSSYDIYDNNTLNEDKNDTLTCFDNKCSNWLVDKKIITNYKLDSLGDLKIYLMDEEIIEIYIDTSDDLECWRVFKTNSEQEHIVMKGTGLEYE